MVTVSPSSSLKLLLNGPSCLHIRLPSSHSLNELRILLIYYAVVRSTLH